MAQLQQTMLRSKPLDISARPRISELARFPLLNVWPSTAECILTLNVSHGVAEIKLVSLFRQYQLPFPFLAAAIPCKLEQPKSFDTISVKQEHVL